MSDLIRKADALTIFCMRCVRVIDCVNDMTGNFKNNCPIKKELDDLPSAEPKWIPVSEGLPEDYQDVLVWFEYFRYGDYNCMYSTYGIGNYSNRYDSWSINHESGWTDLHVFAWMPMPEPPKMEGEQE